VTIGDPSPLPAEPDCTVTGDVFALHLAHKNR
jgi:hypothetical protein